VTITDEDIVRLQRARDEYYRPKEGDRMAKNRTKIKVKPAPAPRALPPPTHLGEMDRLRVQLAWAHLTAAVEAHNGLLARLEVAKAAVAGREQAVREAIDAARPGHVMGPQDTVDPTTGAITRAGQVAP